MEKENRFIKSKEELRKNLKFMRKYNNVTQAEIADKLGMDRSTYAYYETGKTVPGIFTLIKISEFLGCDINSLIKAK